MSEPTPEEIVTATEQFEVAIQAAFGLPETLNGKKSHARAEEEKLLRRLGLLHQEGFR